MCNNEDLFYKARTLQVYLIGEETECARHKIYTLTAPRNRCKLLRIQLK